MKNQTKITTTKTWYSLTNRDDEPPELSIYDEIGGFGISAEAFIKELRSIKAKTINLHLNTPGGGVFDGIAIANAIRGHKANVVGFIDGMAASIGSVIACACDQLNMAENSFLMVHNPRAVTLGTADDMRTTADLLDKTRTAIAKTYIDKTGKDEKEVYKWMDDETWFSAEEAMEAGFADSLTEAVEMTACFDVSKFQNAPAGLKNMVQRSATGEDTSEVNIMAKEDIESFKAQIESMKAEHATALIAAYDKGKADAVPKPAKAHELKAVFPDDSGFCMDMLTTDATLEAANAEYVKIVSAKLKAANGEITTLKASIEKAATGQAAVVIRGAAENDWKAQGFTSERAYQLYAQNKDKGNVLASA